MKVLKEGIVFEVSTSNFDEAAELIEQTFDIFDIEGWFDVRELKDFKKLSDFLKAMDVDNKTFRIQD